jgi:hypothetical protein
VLKEIDDLTPHIASAKSADALLGGYQNFYARWQPVAIESKRLTRQAFCSIPNCCRACARPKS